MKPFTFALMLLRQRVDEQLRLEQQKRQPDSARIGLLSLKRLRLALRLRRSLTPRALPGG